MGASQDRVAPLIGAVIWRVGREDMKALRKALREACPFGDKSIYMRRVWWKEARRQLAHPLNTPGRSQEEEKSEGLLGK